MPQTRPQRGDGRVLLIEDEVLLRSALAEELRAAGLTVIEAVSADEAWAYLQADGRVDLIFSDICMPGSMDGIEFAGRVRDRHPGLPIILTSGNLQPALRDGFVEFLPKPYAFAKAVERALANLLPMKLRNSA